MKFRTCQHIDYFKNARHKGGHGIHSPFLFHLITTVIEDKKQYPENKMYGFLKNEALHLLLQHDDADWLLIYKFFGLSPQRPKKLLNRIEISYKYCKLICRLIRYFKPTEIVYCGLSLGVNSSMLAMVQGENSVLQINIPDLYRSFYNHMVRKVNVPENHYLSDNFVLSSVGAVVVINLPYQHEKSREFFNQCIDAEVHPEVLIIKGIHESREMNLLWLEIVSDQKVRVTLDLFDIGIVLFRDGLQKENFVLRF